MRFLVMDYTFRNMLKYEEIKVLSYSLVLLLMPFVLPGPQYLTGTLVNTILFISAYHLRGLKVLPVIVIPSISVLLTGYIFGNASNSLIYMVPVIWIGNAIIVFGMRHLEKLNYFKSVLTVATLKTLILFTGAFMLFQNNLVPLVILNSMGIMQFLTAISGGIFAYFLIRK